MSWRGENMVEKCISIFTVMKLLLFLTHVDICYGYDIE